MTLYITSYGKSEDKGIYTLGFDEATMQITITDHIRTQDFPSYAIISGDHLYVAFKNASSNNDGGGLSGFQIEHGRLVLTNQYSSSGRSYTHLCISPDGNYIFAANYHIGATASYALDNGKIDHKIMAVRHRGKGTDLLKRQLGPHVHNVGFTPDQKYLYAVDLGADKVVFYHWKNGTLTEDVEHTLSVSPGTGPRHMIFSHDGRFAYLVNEIANTVMVFKYVDERLILIQNVSTIPHHFTGFSAAAAIRLTPSGEHLFVSNRGHDSIAMFRVNKNTGKISLLYMTHTGKEPRDFNLIDNKYLIIACQNENAVQVATFDEDNEKLLMTPYSTALPQPVCVVVPNTKEL